MTDTKSKSEYGDDDRTRKKKTLSKKRENDSSKEKKGELNPHENVDISNRHLDIVSKHWHPW